MARVLLIYPQMKVLAPRFPYSVLPLAGALLDAGHEARILDAQVEALSDADPAAYDVIGISTYSGSQIVGALKAASHVRELAPGRPLVWGGVHPTITPHQTVSNPMVDIVVRGEGEATLLELVDALEGVRPLRGVAGLTFREDGELVDTGERGFIDLDELPFLPYQLIKPERYVHFKEKPSRVYLETSRGCPHNCGFCYNEAVHQRRWRSKSVARVLDEFEYILETLKPDEIWPSDDNFATDRRRVEAIARGKIEKGLGFNWIVSSRFDYAVKYDDDFLDLLKESGCRWLTFGGESGSQRMLDLMCKGISPDKMRDTVGHLKRSGIICGANFMAGYPDETAGDLDETFDLIDELVSLDKSFEPGISIYTPFPGTPLYARALEAGFEEPGSLEQWGKYRYSIVDNLPWLVRKQRNLLRTVGLISRFDFAAGEYRGRGLLSGRRLLSAAYRVLNASARFRWKHRFFNPAPEWRVVDWALRAMRFWER